MLADVGSKTPSKDVPAEKYVEAVAAGASHDEAVKFADDSYKKLRAKIDEIHKRIMMGVTLQQKLPICGVICVIGLRHRSLRKRLLQDQM